MIQIRIIWIKRITPFDVNKWEKCLSIKKIITKLIESKKSARRIFAAIACKIYMKSSHLTISCLKNKLITFFNVLFLLSCLTVDNWKCLGRVTNNATPKNMQSATATVWSIV